jgi:hypothetical protein
VTLGLGADRFTSGGGADVFNFAAADTGFLIGQAASATITGAFNTAGLDVITGMSAGMTIQFTGLGANTTATTLVRNGTALGNDTAGSVALIVGNYDAATNTFTVSSTGTSSMLVYDSNGSAAGGDYRAVVLVGYVDLAGNDTISNGGLFTSVGG